MQRSPPRRSRFRLCQITLRQADLRIRAGHWPPPNGFTGKVHHVDARVGGAYKMPFTNFTTGHSHSFGGKYLELVPNERIRHTDKSDDPNLPGEMQTTIDLKAVSCGTEVNINQSDRRKFSKYCFPISGSAS